MWLVLTAAGVVCVTISGLAAAIAFGTAPPPREMASVSAPMRLVDFTDLPKPRQFTARDGASLTYRLYPHDGERVVVLIHGSSGESSGMHALARAIAAAGFAVYVPDLRGHNADGRLGDIDYPGQLDDDLADLMHVVRHDHPMASVSLVGHSSGGGFVLRIAEGRTSALFARYVLLSPALPYNAPTWRPGSGGWASPYKLRIIALTILDRFGIGWFQHLPVVAFAVARDAPVRLAPTYSAVMLRNFGPPRDGLARLAQVRAPMALLIGADDEIFYADRFAPLLHPLKTDLPIQVVPGVDHMGMVTRPEALTEVVAALR